MYRSSTRGALALVAVALAGAGCSSNPIDPTTPTTPSAVTESSTGTLTINGSVTFPYVVGAAGSTNVTIKALDPEAFITLKADGVGDFIGGETVYQGESLDTATWQATLQTWTRSASSLAVKGFTGAFAIDNDVKGADSGAVWNAGAFSTTVVGLALGTWSGTVCSVVLSADLAGVGSLIAGSVQGQGSLCARVYDVGKITTPVTFTIEVTHF